MNIREIIQDIAKDNLIKKAQVAQVQSVDDYTCDVLTLEDEVVLTARLQTESAGGILITPTIGSMVVIMPIADFEFVVVMYSAIDMIKFLDGSYGGLTKVDNLTTKLNNLENQVNTFLTTLQSIIIPLAPSGTYPFAPLFAAITALTPTISTDIENNKVTHGT